MRLVAIIFCGLFISAAWCDEPAPVPASVDDVPVATHVYAGVALSDEDAAAAAPREMDVPSRRGDGALVSINTDSPLDMNWSGAMELVDPALRPAGVILPFLEEHPLDNLEVRFRLLNLRF